MNGTTWLKSQLALTDNQRWGAKEQHSHGVLRLPANEPVHVTETLEIPHRHGLEGPETHVLDRPGFVGPDQPLDGPLLRTLTGPLGAQRNWNGNFNSAFENFFMDCRGSAGLEWGGAQSSWLANLCIRHSTDAITIRPGSTRVEGRAIDIENGEPLADTRIGNGLTFQEVRGAHFAMVNVHCADAGLRLRNSESVTLKAVLEKVNTVEVSGLGNTLDLNWQWPSEVPLNLKGDQGGQTIFLAVSKLPSDTLYYRDNRGQLRLLAKFTPQAVVTHDRTRGNRTVYLEIRTRWNTTAKRGEVAVDVKTWNS